MSSQTTPAPPQSNQALHASDASHSQATTPNYSPKSVFTLTRRLFWYKPWLFWSNVLLWSTFHLTPVLMALLVSQVFAKLEQHNIAAAWLALLFYGAVRFMRIGILFASVSAFIKIWNTIEALIRRNLLAYLLNATGSRRLPDTSAEAVSRFRDDVEDISHYVEDWIDVLGVSLAAISAIYLMSRVDLLITLLVCLPLLIIVGVVRGLSGTIRAYRRRMREATARVTSFIGETFGAISAIKLAGHEHYILSHFRHLGESRRQAALKDVLLTQFISGINSNMVNLAVGIVLLLGANLVVGGQMQAADFVLFIALLPRLTNQMGFFGDMMANHRRTNVSYERLNRMLVDAPSDITVQHHSLDSQQQPPVVELDYQPLQKLEVRQLQALYPNGLGLQDVSFELQRGDFVVITGRIGSGKTTLLRSILGLIPKTGGQVLWNDQPVSDPASFFVPPHSSYTAQIPNLFSESLQQNILTGVSDDRQLQQAIELAVLAPDLKELHSGLDTPVGTRGVKLSGGQIQRAAVARMLARQADLLVFDDVSSALDASTENELWNGLGRELNVTCLVVSHRRVALSRASKIVLLQDGRVADSGSLSELLERSAEMRALWAADEA